APAPGPNGMMKRTGCCGQACVWASAGGTDKAKIATRARKAAPSFDISHNPDARNDGRKLERFHFCWMRNYAANSVYSPPPCGEGLGVGSVLVHAFRATTPTPTPPAFAALRRATLPTRGRVRPSSPLVLIALHQTCSNRRIPAAQRSPLRLVEAGKADIDGADGVDLEGDGILAGLDRERRHHRPGDDDFSAAQPLAEGREHIGDVAHDADPLPGIGLRIAGAREFASTPNDAASEAVRGAAGARRSAATQHHVALIDVAAENALGILRRRGEIDDLDRRRDAGDRGLGGLM